MKPLTPSQRRLLAASLRFLAAWTNEGPDRDDQLSIFGRGRITPEDATESALCCLALDLDAEDGTETKGIEQVCADYMRAAAWLRGFRSTRFQPGTPVRVACDFYTGPGRVVVDPTCPPHKVAVQVAEDDVRLFQITNCQPVTDP